jgi:hypothetical protein
MAHRPPRGGCRGFFRASRLPVSTAYAYRQRKMQLRHRAAREMAQKYVVISF